MQVYYLDGCRVWWCGKRKVDNSVNAHVLERETVTFLRNYIYPTYSYLFIYL